MTIHTQESVSGFVASSPQLTQTEKGDARLYFRFGQEHFRKEDDGSFVPRQVVGRISSLSKLGMVGSARPRWTSRGRFQAIASWGRTSLYSVR